MRYEWDEAKRRSNLRKHGIDFVDCETVFEGFCRTVPDDRFQYYEERFISVGLLRDQVIVIAHTESQDLIRIISARKAKRREQELYCQDLPNRF